MITRGTKPKPKKKPTVPIKKKENSNMAETDKKDEKEVKVVKKARKERVPFGGSRMKLSFPEVAGKVRRWVNDVGGRCQLAEEGGYDFVTDEGQKIGDTAVGSGNQDLGSRVSRIVGTLPDGSPQRAFLMEIDKDLYDEDQAEKQSKLDVIDAQIRGGNVEGRVGADGRYIPKEGITYK